MEFSIVTPTFKQPDWVRLCAASVADQTGVSCEHIIQDGGDGQGLEWLGSIPTARLFVEPDLGMYDALTKGIARAAGDFIGHLNSDEQYLPGSLQIVHQFLTDYPEIEVLFGDAILISSRGTPLSYLASESQTAVCQVKFTEWTRDDRLRQPVFLGIREDKNAIEVVREKATLRQ